MQDHLYTEKVLHGYVAYPLLVVVVYHSLNDPARSGLTYTSIREGVYAECFTIFLDWYPERTGSIVLPADGEVAFTSRAELGEATARIMIQGGYENQTILFTAEETILSLIHISEPTRQRGRSRMPSSA